MQQSIEAFVSDMSARLDAIDGGAANADLSADLPTLRRILYLLQSLRETLADQAPERRREASSALMAEFRQGMAAMAAARAKGKSFAALESEIRAAPQGRFAEGEVVPFNRGRRRASVARLQIDASKPERDLSGRNAGLHFTRPAGEEQRDVREQINAIADRRRGSQASLDRQSAAASVGHRHVATDPLHPIEMAWRMLPGIIRSLEQQLGKSISFVAAGGRIEVSRSLIDAVRVPLIYLTRNAADHGLEISRERLRCGKSPVGTIRISASRDADDVVVELSDDGRGLDPDNIAKLAAAGFLASGDADDGIERSPTRSLPAAAVADTADMAPMFDRGIGLDAVRQHIEMTGGRISLRSRPGCGVTVVIRIPAFAAQESSASSSDRERAACLPNFPR